MPGSLEVVMLGTGSPLPSAFRCGAGQVVVAAGQRILIDCGWGAARRLYAAQLPPQTIDTVCFTHMHSDHISDVADFLISRWTGGAERPLTVYGPEGTRGMIDGFLAALSRDIGYRFAHHGEKLSRAGIRCEVHEVTAAAQLTPVVSLMGVEIECFEVDHRPVVPAFGYRLTYAGLHAVFSGDTKVCDSLRQAAVDADLLVCEAMNLAMLEQLVQTARLAGNVRAAALGEDVPSYRAPTLEVAAMARDSTVKELVLSHIIPPIGTDARSVAAFTDGMAALYPGPLRVAQDLERIRIEQR